MRLSLGSLPEPLLDLKDSVRVLWLESDEDLLLVVGLLLALEHVADPRVDALDIPLRSLDGEECLASKRVGKRRGWDLAKFLCLRRTLVEPVESAVAAAARGLEQPRTTSATADAAG